MQSMPPTDADSLPQWSIYAGAAVAFFNVVVLTVLNESFQLFKGGSGAPFVPIAAQKLDRLFSSENGCLRDLAGQGLHLVDLGSGTGSIVRAAAREGGFARSSGYEINPWLYRLSALASLGRPNERLHLVSLWDAPLDDADVVVVYGYPSFIERLGAKLGEELQEGAIVVSNAYEIPDSVAHLHLIDEIAVETPPWDPDASSSLWLYRVSREEVRGSETKGAVLPSLSNRAVAAQRLRSSAPQRSSVASDCRSDPDSRDDALSQVWGRRSVVGSACAAAAFSCMCPVNAALAIDQDARAITEDMAALRDSGIPNPPRPPTPPAALMLRAAEVCSSQAELLETGDQARLVARQQVPLFVSVLIRNTNLELISGTSGAAASLRGAAKIAEVGVGAFTSSELRAMAKQYRAAQEDLRVAFESLPLEKQQKGLTAAVELRIEEDEIRAGFARQDQEAARKEAERALSTFRTLGLQ